MRVSPKYDPEYHGTVIRTNYIPKFYQNAVYICPFGLFENIDIKMLEISGIKKVTEIIFNYIFNA